MWLHKVRAFFLQASCDIECHTQWHYISLHKHIQRIFWQYKFISSLSVWPNFHDCQKFDSKITLLEINVRFCGWYILRKISHGTRCGQNVWFEVGILKIFMIEDLENGTLSYSTQFYDWGNRIYPELSWLTLNIDQKMWVGAWSSNNGDKPLNITRDNK